MDFRILNRYEEIIPFISAVRTAADRHRESFGFVPATAYEYQAAAGKLWVAITPEQSYAGHILFGGRYPYLRVFQIFSVKEMRRKGVARKLLQALIDYGEEHGWVTIAAHVAADLSSNTFWENAGFQIYQQKKGGKARNRIINVRGRELGTHSLFCHEKTILRLSQRDIKYADGPILRSPTYVLDLNVLFDALKDRAATKYAQALIGAALNNQIRLCVSAEFVEELARHAKGGEDPLVRFALNLPVLPPAAETELNDIAEQLRPVIFPSRTFGDSSPINDTSDLRHLANAIIHRTRGFITGERAILAACELLKDTYAIEVVSPADLFAQEFVEPHPIGYLGSELVIKDSSELERCDIERFLVAQGVPLPALGEVWESGTGACSRRRICARRSGDIVAIASWTVPTKCQSSVSFYLFVNESDPDAELLISHFIELTQLDIPAGEWVRWRLVTRPLATKTRSVAVERGFRVGLECGSSSAALSKLGFRGILSEENWETFVQDFRDATGISVHRRMPTYLEFSNTGVEMRLPGNQIVFVRLFELETLISPAIVLCSGRKGILLPIQAKFADELLYGLKVQHDLFGASSALLHVEKAYFRAAARASMFEAGLLLVFYVSAKGGGRAEAIGVARITYSSVLPPEEAVLSLSTQGVLPREQLESMAGRKGVIHAFTFDNVNYFQRALPFGWLKERRLIGGANLVTAEPLSAKQIETVFLAGFSAKNG